MNIEKEEIRESIQSLINEAEMAAQLLAKQQDNNLDQLSAGHLPESQITLIAEEIKRFRAEFEGQVSDDIIEKTLANMLRPAIDRWLELNMAAITRDVVSKKLDEITRDKLSK
ncbi:DUF2497 domain-containing protein [Polynucleobacter sp. AP-Elch-400A-B2]|jgi:cell pole-organizing protein PopZ|uniref:DUF2497 domain-containing protein n=1 Tax=Polynucleobacter sp. AP-Elch-400A-B2 TaxID=2576930 RepID=UPI001BFE6A74|nr:DUF2497 domain-containing protein [Polynucleobacter sp. AP-Elch-400A-B2]QWE25204.1 DUF2497 domain-containing protein [Polynucleobacter sp. AP-Elch-400A-B2]